MTHLNTPHKHPRAGEQKAQLRSSACAPPPYRHPHSSAQRSATAQSATTQRSVREKPLAMLLAILLCLALGTSASIANTGCTPESTSNSVATAPAATSAASATEASFSNEELAALQAPDGETCVDLNAPPDFPTSSLTTTAYERYSDLDHLGRCGVAEACVGPETMPTEERGSIGSVKPTGWHISKYDFVEGRYLYNRSHLIAYCLTAENANERNLITGTRYLNAEGMLPFENAVARYIDETGNHVLYRATPIFIDDELVARGVHLEAFSVEDNGEGICFNIYVPNVQPGIEIDYATGDNWLAGEAAATKSASAGNASAASAPSANTPGSSPSATNAPHESISPTRDPSENASDAQTAPTPSGQQQAENPSDAPAATSQGEAKSYVLNTSSKRFHIPTCSSVSAISEKNRSVYEGTRDSLIAQGYAPCKRCNP